MGFFFCLFWLSLDNVWIISDCDPIDVIGTAMGNFPDNDEIQGHGEEALSILNEYSDQLEI